MKLKFILAACVLAACSPESAQTTGAGPEQGAPPAAETAPGLLAQFASPEGEVCYSRAYDDAHLAAHPNQTVQVFWIAPPDEAFRAINTPELTHVGFGYILRDVMDTFTGIGICREEGERAACDVEGDGGQFTIARNGAGLRVEIARMQVEGQETVSDDLAEGDNRVILLSPGQPGDCLPD
ncbi:MAG: hypothetical protein AB7J28_17190 [Hyphomonadaceae bacterium]